jgi:hypothetical protein
MLRPARMGMITKKPTIRTKTIGNMSMAFYLGAINDGMLASSCVK